jgi:hypothetical protein
MSPRHPDDDATIPDDSDLWRRIHPDWIVYDENLKAWRLSSQAFNDDSEGGPMSVVLAPEVLASGRTPIDILARFRGYGSAAVRAALARELNQGVKRDPEPDEPAHAVVVGKKTSSVRKSFSRGARWEVSPPDRPAPPA